MLPPLKCPHCKADVTGDECVSCKYRVPIVDGVYQYVQEGYAESFGNQWRTFARTQLDSANGTTVSEDRFRAVTGWTPDDLADKSVLDVGCGAGRFTEVAIKWGARVTAVDLSEAVFAARGNVRDAHRARFVQANALELPFAKGSFDFVFSIGVAQHTPDPLGFVRHVSEMVRPGGRAALWIYERRLSTLLHWKYLLRPITRQLSPKQNLRFVNALVSGVFPIAKLIEPLPAQVRRVAFRVLPIAVYLGQVPLPNDQQKEWSILDTLDWYSPRYDSPQTFENVARVVREAGAVQVDRGEARGVTVRASF